MAKVTSQVALALLLVLATLAGECLANLRVGFYHGKCGQNDVESIVFGIVKAKFIKDPTLVAALLRMQFHDCFVRGCDASILLDGKNTEKTSPPNLGVRGYEVIDEVKASLEKLCPGVVSCADIIAIATRVSVVMARGYWYNVETGRRDGRVSNATEVFTLPPPTISVANAIKAFAAKGINKEEFVLLQGAHTVGVAHCIVFQDRLYNFNGVAGKTDPTLNPALIPALKRACPRNGFGNNTVFLDQTPKSGNIVDNGFYKAIKARKGVLRIDQLIAIDPSTKAVAEKYAADNTLFQIKFGKAMVKLGRVGVLTGNQGEVRKSCRRVNPSVSGKGKHHY